MKVAPFAGAWIEILWVDIVSITSISRSLRGSVDWNTITVIYMVFVIRRSLRGSVDWNSSILYFLIYFIVAPFAGAWIEITKTGEMIKTLTSRSLRGSVDWNLQVLVSHYSLRMSLPSRERGLKYNHSYLYGFGFGSLPSRERGLKYSRKQGIAHLFCRSLRGSVDWNWKYRY